MDAENNVAGSRRRRFWSVEEKAEMLAEATKSSYTSVAARHNLHPSLLFRWRLQLEGKPLFPEAPTGGSPSPDSPREELEQQLAEIKELEEMKTAVVGKLRSELKEGKISAYNASNAFASIVQSTARLLIVRSEISEKLQALPPVEPPRELEEWEHPSLEIQREAEKTIYFLIKEQVERKQKEKALAGGSQ